MWALFQNFILLRAELRFLAPHTEQPPKTKVFWALLPFKHHYHPISLLLKHKVLHILFVHHWPIIQNFSMLHILLFCMALLLMYSIFYLPNIW